MKRMIIAVAIAMVVTPIGAGGALAGGSELGTPGDPNCSGQSVAVFAQASKHDLIEDAPGVGNVSKAFDRSVHDTQELLRAFCDGA